MAALDEPINILLVGETGVGKSLFVNGIVNYITYGDINNALTKFPTFPIPVQFTINDAEDRSHRVRAGKESSSENLEETGQSATRQSQSYLIKSENFKVRIIDTPGIADTLGQDQDKINLKNIVDILSNYETIHAIAFLLKPNESRLTVTLQYCLYKLFAELHQSATKNIVFIFTNGRSSFYRPGDTKPTLQKMLDEIKTKNNVDIPFNQNNTFVVDNEAIRYVACFSQNIKLPKENIDRYEKSWDVSSSACQKLIKYLRNTEPHSIKKMVSISRTRLSIELLQQPLMTILMTINDNQTALKAHQNTLENCETDDEKLKDQLYVPKLQLETKALSVPQTVCTSNKCRSSYTVHGIEKYHYSQVCCGNCFVEFTTTAYNYLAMISNLLFPVLSAQFDSLSFLRNIVLPKLNLKDGNAPMKLFCQTMSLAGTCKKCECDIKDHMLQYFSTVLVEERCKSEAVDSDIDQNKNVLREKENVMEQIRGEIFSMGQEKSEILSAIANFSTFLDQNAIVTYDDMFQCVLDQLKEFGIADVFADVRDEYEELKTAIKRNISAEEIDEWIEKLKRLPKFGNLVTQGMELAEHVTKTQQKCRYKEQEFKVSNNWFNQC